MIICVDFDGTVVEHQFPDMGPPVPGAVETLRELHAAGHQLILWTVRTGPYLRDAVAFMATQEIPLFGINKNPNQPSWSDPGGVEGEDRDLSPKAYCDIYIDDLALGCPLMMKDSTDPKSPVFVNWRAVRPAFGLPKDWEDDA